MDEVARTRHAVFRSVSGERGTGDAAKARHIREATMSLKLSSTAFEANAAIPVVHTCDGPGTAPPLAWTGAPSGTRAFALIADDPDAPDPAAPTRTFVHWVVYGIPASATSVVDGNGLREGLNDRGQRGYTGPCPPKGRHRYFFKLYALDTELGDLGEPTKAELERAMKDHVLEKAELIGTYEHVHAKR